MPKKSDSVTTGPRGNKKTRIPITEHPAMLELDAMFRAGHLDEHRTVVFLEGGKSVTSKTKMTVLVAEDVAEAARAMSYHEKRSISQIVEDAVREHVADREQERGSPYPRREGALPAGRLGKSGE